MPTYVYKARDGVGKPVKGTMEAPSREEIIAKLRRMGYMTTRIIEKGPAIEIGSRVGSILERLKPISTDEMVMFYVQFSNMINAGLPILTSLDALSKEIENKKLKETISDIAINIKGGASFSQGLEKHPRIFPRLVVNMIKAGEASGKLDTVLAKYAEYFENQADLRQKINGALFYPMILLASGIIVTLFIVTFVIPQFVEIFIKAGIRLPMPTLLLYMIGKAIKYYWYLVCFFVVIIWMAVKFYVKTENGRLKIDRLKLTLPLFGSLYRKAALSRFSRTLGTLTASGVPILESLDITSGVLENEVLSRIVNNTRKAVEKGETISESLKVSGEFPHDTIQMISVGEETGNLDGMLGKVADFYDIYLGYTVKKLTTILEPLFLLIMGSLVGFIMASILLPIFDMVKTLRH